MGKQQHWGLMPHLHPVSSTPGHFILLLLQERSIVRNIKIFSLSLSLKHSLLSLPPQKPCLWLFYHSILEEHRWSADASSALWRMFVPKNLLGRIVPTIWVGQQKLPDLPKIPCQDTVGSFKGRNNWSKFSKSSLAFRQPTSLLQEHTDYKHFCFEINDCFNWD